MDDAGDVAAVVLAGCLRRAEELHRDVVLADAHVGQGAFAGLGGGDPWPVADTTDALVVEHERVVPLGEVGPPGLAGDHTGEHGVVPVHGPAVLGRERVVALMANGVREQPEGELPVGTFVAEFLGDGDGAAEAVGDRRRAGEERERPGSAVGMPGPEDLTAWLLELEHEIDRRLDDLPHLLEIPEIAEVEVVVPDAGGDVGDDVGVELVLLDLVLEVVLVPRAVGPLDVDEPLVGRFGLGSALADDERHRRFDVVPRVGVTAREPRDHSRAELPRRDVVGGVAHLLGREDAGDLRQHSHPPALASIAVATSSRRPRGSSRGPG